ncbi:MAG: outer membrane beta-barrel protein [Planctomycetaceae bacterium]
MGSNPTLSAILVPLIVLVSVLPALAQNRSAGRVEIVGGVAAIDSSALVGGVGPGWIIGGGWHATPWLAVGFELDRTIQSDDIFGLGVNASVLGTMATARMSVSLGPVRPLFQVLAGQTQVSLRVHSQAPVPSFGSSIERHGALQVGGGIEVPIHSRFAVRVTVDRRRVLGPTPFWQNRVTTVATLRLGRG